VCVGVCVCVCARARDKPDLELAHEQPIPLSRQWQGTNTREINEGSVGLEDGNIL
jgi:hypothetical protein